MKNSAVLASLLFGSFAVAAPVDRRALIYKTEVVIETVVVYTTVYEDEPVAQATTTPAGYFYEQPKVPSSVAASSTSSASSTAAAYTSSVEVKSSIYVAPISEVSTPTPTPSPSPAPVETPQPATSAVYVASVEVVSSAASVVTPTPVVVPVVTPTPAVVPVVTPTPAVVPVVTSTPAVVLVATPTPSAVVAPVTGGTTTGDTYSNVDVTIYDNNGTPGACGVALYDTDMVVALAKPAWGDSTYNVMTGVATNPWCGQKIKIDYNGNSIVATIMDLCPGCAGSDIDLSVAAWRQLTGSDERTRYKGSWSKIS